MIGKRMAFLLLVLLMMSFSIGCNAADEGILLGKIGNEKVWLGNLAYELWDTNNSYIAGNDYYREKYGIDISEGEGNAGNIRDEAYGNLVRTYVLCQKAQKEGESLSTSLQENNRQKAEGILGELDGEFISRYKITKEDLCRYLDYQSLAGIWFGNRIEEIKDTVRKDLAESASENEVRLKAYDIFEEEYEKMLSETNIELDNSLRNEVSIQ